MYVTIWVGEKDADEAVKIGRTPWDKTTVDEQKEWDRLISNFGLSVALKILNR
jgi:hypothetical protein